MKQEVGDHLKICILNLLLEFSTLPSLMIKNLMKVNTKFFLTDTWTDVGHVIKGCGFNGGSFAFHVKLAPCLDSCPWVFWMRRFNVFVCYKATSLRSHAKSLRLATIGDTRHCASGDVFNFSRDLKWPHVSSIIWIHELKLPTINHHLVMFGGHWSNANSIYISISIFK